LELERDNILWRALNAMEDYRQQLSSAAELFEHCTRLMPDRPAEGDSPEALEAERCWRDRRWQILQWRLIPCRDAVLAIFHFRMAMGAARKQALNMPLLRDHIDSTVFDRAIGQFDELFKGWEEMRNAVGHSAEFQVDRVDVKKHWLADDRPVPKAEAMSLQYGGNGRHFVQGLNGHSFILTSETELWSLDLKAATANLLKVMRVFYSGFINDDEVILYRPQR
jgi:hypothetical protein